MRLTANFDSDEFACPCCGAARIDTRLVFALQALRDALGAPIRVTSGYRCKRHNKAVRGVPSSQHLRGTAADVVVDGISPQAVAEAAEGIEDFAAGGIGIYGTFTHLDVRRGKARWRG